MIPLEVRIALHQGRELAARVACSRDGWHAWIWVRPVMKSGQTYAQVQAEWTRTRRASRYDDTIAHFQIRYTELSDWHLADEWFYDLDIAIEQRPIVDKNLEVRSEISLEEVVSSYVPDLSQLKTPSAVNYPL